MTIPKLSPPSPTYLLEFVASQHNLTSSQLIVARTSARHSRVKFEAAWKMREFGHSWPVIAKALGYAHHCSAMHACREWERMRSAPSPSSRRPKTETSRSVGAGRRGAK